MKKTVLTRFIKTACSALVMLTMALIINSCRKDNKLTGQQANAVEAASHFPVADAKAWFGNNKATLATKIKLNSETAFLSKFSNFTPLWDSARTAADTNFYVVEVPAKYVNKIGFNTDETQNNINGITRLLVLKDKRNGNLSAALMQVHAEPGIDINNVHYMAVPKKFSGNIFYTTLQGLFINGNIYKNGKITLSSKKNSQVRKPNGPQVLLLLAPGECATTTIDYYERTCTAYSNGSETCSGWVYLYTEQYTFCAPVGDGGGGSGGVDPGPTCSPPTNPNPPIAVESIKGKIFIRVEYGGGGDNPCSACQAEREEFSNQPAPIADDTDVSISGGTSSPTDPNRRTKIYTWICGKNPTPLGWKLTSVETGVHKKVGYDWTWESLTHSNTNVSGFFMGGTIDIHVLGANGVIENNYNAHMELIWSSTMTFQCAGLPLLTTSSSPIPSKSKNWHVDN